MDSITSAISHYAVGIRYDDLPERVVHEAKRRLLDSLGVALASYSAEPVKVARSAALGFPGKASLLGTADQVSVEWATFVNALMIRYLDFNDTYLSKEPLHPSDMYGPAISVAEQEKVGGKDLITSVAIGYEVAVRMCDAGSLRLHGWDHVNYTGIGHVLVAGKLMGLNEEQMSHALSIQVISHASMRQTRVGELSHWKAATTANQARNAVFSAIVARSGMTGPDKPFEGEMGFIRQLLAGEFDPSPLKDIINMSKPSRILDTYIKPYPVEYHAQSAVEAAVEIRREAGPIEPDQVEYIKIETFKAGYDIIAKDPEKWDPKTKETADHSLMWATATALLKGDLWLGDYEASEIRNPKVLALLRKTKVSVEPELDKLYPRAIPNKVIVKLINGKEFERRIDHPRGHPMNPMTDEEVEAKFRKLTKSLLTEKQQAEVIGLAWKLDELATISKIIKAATI